MAKTLLLTATEPNLAFVCFFGVAVVFFGLAILIGLVYLMNILCDKLVKSKPEKASVKAPVATTQTASIPKREELVAAITAAVAEEEGTDISAIRVLSFKKIN